MVLGVPTNVEYLRLLLADPDVQAGRLDTNLIERKLPDMAFRHVDAADYAAAALVAREPACASAAPGARDRHSFGRFPTDGRGRPFGLLDAAYGNTSPAPSAASALGPHRRVAAWAIPRRGDGLRRHRGAPGW